MLDIDHLKQINDKFGHPAGDVVIRQIAQTLKEVSRDNDTARVSAAKSLVCCLPVSISTRGCCGWTIALGAHRQTCVEGVGTVTVSIGVAGCPENATSERALYAASDRALYVSKNSGRDRVSVAPPLQEKLPYEL